MAGRVVEAGGGPNAERRLLRAKARLERSTGLQLMLACLMNAPPRR